MNSEDGYRQQKVFEGSLFYEDLLYFALCTHLIPLREHSLKYFPEDKSTKVTMIASSSEEITTVLRELPDPSSMNFIQLSASSMINSCYEKLKRNHLPCHAPIVEFFRHVRNAASHNRVFTFTKNEPIRPAVWRGFSITKELEGKSLFEFIAIADAVLLLEDIEKHLEESVIQA